MKIAIIADPLDNQRAGVHVYMRELVRALVLNPGPHDYILIRQQLDSELPLKQYIIPQTKLPVGYASIRLFVLIPRLLRQLKVDAVFEPAHFGPFNLPRHVRRITMIHDLTPILFPQFHPWLSRNLQKRFLPSILSRADMVIANSRNTERDLHEVYPVTRGKTTTILLGRNEAFQPDHGPEFRKTISHDGPYFLFVGTIEPRKNLTLLLEAYQLFREHSSERIALVLVGQKGWKNGAFEEALVTHPYRSDIILPGFLPRQQLYQAYTQSLAMIYPSVYEGFGFPILEALACGTIAICPANSSLPEVGGNVALYYPTHRVKTLFAHMQQVAAGGNAVRVRRAAGPKWAAKFTWKKYAQAFNAAMSRLEQSGKAC